MFGKFQASKRVIGCLVTIIALGAIPLRSETIPSPTTTGTVTPEWTANMRKMATVVSDIMVDISSAKRFSDPSRASAIDKNAKELSTLVHQFANAKFGLPDSDPSVFFILSLFKDEAARASKELDLGHREYARSVLKSLTTYCVACHTRVGGETAAPLFADEAKLSVLSPSERIEVLTMSRRFAQALQEAEAIISNEVFMKSNPLEWERAVDIALVISVRVLNDPDLSLRLTERLSKTKAAPMFLQNLADRWTKSIQEWKKESRSTPKTEEGYFQQTNKLFQKAGEIQHYPNDRGGEIYYLRASALVHEWMKKFPSGPRLGDAFLLAGISYQALRDLELWELHDYFYDACIQKAPHTETSKQCYYRIEESIIQGYTGSQGTFVPEEVQGRLAKLKMLAFKDQAKELK